ncbi:LysR substrate-binding domain-containing protein [Pseudoalteromonas rubra]|uniref:LysR family transcriptional regulator n=1 Tax=Pseudoalteromonas rubra TaxID=43658 RepID=A0A5S3X4P1_9GAMM|nr:LysR substrate-binding domain-containing protein [Pseudoalteromonas rubra]TMP39269.1 LysR family transcriptional regulator [Pseudoalteromonas rubra]
MFKNMNLLVTFECAARHQSYSLAAAELCISQAAVSQQMRLLEQQLAQRLFVRTGRHMQLTQAGETLHEHIAPALTMIGQGINRLRQEELAGELCISSTQAFNTLWLMPRLQEFASLYPQIRIRLHSSASFEDLQHARIDLAIRFGTEVEKHTPTTLACEYFGTSPVLPVCSAQLAESLPLAAPADLLSTWLVALEQSGAYDWPQWFEAHSVPGYAEHPHWTYVNSTDMALSAVANGHGVTLAVPYLFQRQLDSGELMIPFKLPHPNPVKRYLVYDPNSARITRLKIFMAWLKAQEI